MSRATVWQQLCTTTGPKSVSTVNRLFDPQFRRSNTSSSFVVLCHDPFRRTPLVEVVGHCGLGAPLGTVASPELGHRELPPAELDDLIVPLVVGVDDPGDETEVAGFVSLVVVGAIQVEARFIPPRERGGVLKERPPVSDPLVEHRDAACTVVAEGGVCRVETSSHQGFVPGRPRSSQFWVRDDVCVALLALCLRKRSTLFASEALSSPQLPDRDGARRPAGTSAVCSAVVSGVTANDGERTEDAAHERASCVEHSSCCITGLHEFPSRIKWSGVIVRLSHVPTAFLPCETTPSVATHVAPSHTRSPLRTSVIGLTPLLVTILVDLPRQLPVIFPPWVNTRIHWRVVLPSSDASPQ